MLRLGTPSDAVARWRRRAILRFGFLGALGLAATEIGALVAPFIRVNRIEGLGKPCRRRDQGAGPGAVLGNERSAHPLHPGSVLLTPRTRRDRRRVPEMHPSRMRRPMERRGGPVPLPMPRIAVRQTHRGCAQDSGSQAAAALSHHRKCAGAAHRRYKSTSGHRPHRRVGPVGDRDQRLGLENIPPDLTRPARPPRTFLFARRVPSRWTRR